MQKKACTKCTDKITCPDCRSGVERVVHVCYAPWRVPYVIGEPQKQWKMRLCKFLTGNMQ